PFFPGGMATYTVSPGKLIQEKGPTTDVVLQWGTYYDAADQAGISRIWGGIHPPVDDFNGRKIGSTCGKTAWTLATKYFDGSIASAAGQMAIRQVGTAGCEVRYDTVRGFYHKLQGTANLSTPFTDADGGYVRAENTFAVRTNGFSGPINFYRVSSAL